MNNKFTIDEKIKLKTDTKNFKDGDKIIGNLKLLDRNEVLLGQKDFNVKVKDSLAIYPFVIKDILKELNINPNDISYVKGWMDSDGNGKYDRLYDLEVILEVVNCYCNKDFTVDEVKEIIKELRDSEKNSTIDYRLLTKDTDIPEIDKTYERFTEELNKTLKKYEINTCLRKIHFLAQAYTESNGFRSSKEEDNTSKTYLKSKPYYPYFGRGFLQLTWEGANSGEIGYKQYFEYLEIKDYKKNFNLINSRLDLAFDVSGYFWTRGKLLTKGNSLKSKYPNSKNEYKNYSKTSITYPNKYTTINLNEVADDDNISQLTYLINGIGMYHLNERTKYVNELKKVFNYEKCRNKK